MLKSIRWTLQLWHAGILALALASFGTALYYGFSTLQLQRVDSEMERAARLLADMPLGPNGPGDRGGRRGGRGGGGGGGGGGFNQGPFEGGGGGGGFGRGGQGGFGNPGAPGGAGGFGQTGANAPSGPGAAPQAGGPGGGNPQFGQGGRGPEFGEGRGGPQGEFGAGVDPWAGVSEDALRRIGENEQDQPYFVIWGGNGFIFRASSPDLDVPTAEDRATPPVWSDNASSAIYRTRSDQREVIVQAPFGVRVLVGKSLASERNSLWLLRWELIGAGLAVMSIGLFGGWVLSSRAVRPIKAITETARSISASDLSRRVNVEETDSELGLLAVTLNETFDRLQEAFDRQIRFTGDASHELRTPLSVIHSQTELALSRQRTAEEYRKSLETVLRAAKRMKSLVEALLVLARADAGKLVLHPEKFPLREAAEECLLMAQPRAQEKKVTVKSDLEAFTIEADRTRLMQLMTNLLINAVQYNIESGTVTLTVARHEGAAGLPGEALISVSDTGVGISSEQQKRVFERFFRADEARSREAGGSGLGLAICRSIVEAHHGTITFESEPGRGTTFLVRLPLAPPAEARAAEETAAAPQGA